MFGKKLIKRCPNGHEMELAWRRCPRCTGRAGASLSARDITEQTVVGEAPGAVTETRIVTPSVTRTPARPLSAPAAESAAAPAPAAAPPTRPAAAPIAPAPAATPGASAKPLIACLVGKDGPPAGQEMWLAVGRHKLGKAPREEPGAVLHAVADPYLSKDHAALEFTGQTLTLTDLGSTNGSFVNGARVTTATLGDGDEVRLAGSTFRVVLGRGA
jgi:hypothetical protein